VKDFFAADVFPHLRSGVAWRAVAILAAAVASGTRLAQWCLDQKGEMRLALQSAPGEPDAQAALADFLVHACSSQAGLALLEDPETHGAVTRLLQDSSGPALRASVVVVLAKAASAAGPAAAVDDSSLPLVEEALHLLGERGFLEGLGGANSTDRALLHRKVEALAFLMRRLDARELLCDALEVDGGALDWELIASKCVEDAGAAFGLAMALERFLASAEEDEHVELLTGALDEDEQQRAALQKYAQGGTAPDVDDTAERAMRRRLVFVKERGGRALACLTKDASEAVKGLLARCAFSLAAHQECRPELVQQGLLKMAHSVMAHGAPEERAMLARHALARTLISVDPHLLSESHVHNAVQPLVSLARGDYLLQQLEATLALTNLAVMGGEVQDRIMAGGSAARFDELMWCDNHDVQVAAAELLANCALSDPVLKLLQEPGRLRVWLGLASDTSNFRLCRAAATAVASVCGTEPLSRLVVEDGGVEVLVALAQSGEAELQVRGIGGMALLTSEYSQQLEDGGCWDVLETCRTRGPPGVRDAAARAQAHMNQ